jgi:hypothetical protein
MSPAEAGTILDGIEEPDWRALWTVLQVADDGFDALMFQWRRFHCTLGLEYRDDHGRLRRQRLPAPAVDCIIALAQLGIMPPRSLLRDLPRGGPGGFQSDDHCWLMSKEGEEWRIAGIEDRVLVLKRDGEQKTVDLGSNQGVGRNGVDWTKYCDNRAAALSPLDVPVKSVAITRLVEEVRTGDTAPAGYNRVYNRHNR